MKDVKNTILTEENTRRVEKTDEIVDSVVDSYIARARFGRAKYGIGMEREDFSLMEWLTHLQEELQDATLYIEKLKKIVGGKK